MAPPHSLFQTVSGVRLLGNQRPTRISLPDLRPSALALMHQSAWNNRNCAKFASELAKWHHTRGGKVRGPPGSGREEGV